MNENQRIFIAFLKLGKFLREYCGSENKKHLQDHWSQKLAETIALAEHKNGWFIEDNVLFALRSWGNLLTENQLTAWTSTHELDHKQPKSVALIMAGNIPLVGFHDLLAVLLSGHKALIKLSSNDNVLISLIIDYLISVEPLVENRVSFSDGRMKGFDAVIATGSNNTARYFEHYFGKVPNIIRKNRNSIAVLTGKESAEQLEALGEDIFRYYGLGCRSVSKLFIPEGYDFDAFFSSIYTYHPIIDRQKYANNYDYNKAVYLMSEFKILDNGFLILKEDENYASPIASLFYEKYDALENVRERLKNNSDLLQCVVGCGILEGETAFGETQNPSLTDYADGVDTMDFLRGIN